VFVVCYHLSVYHTAASTGYVVVCIKQIHYLSSFRIQMWVWCDSTWYRSIRRWYKCWWGKILHLWESFSRTVSLGAVSLRENAWNRISPKVNVWCTLIHEWVSGPFYYDNIITSNSFLHVLESYSLLQLSNNNSSLILHLDSTHVHFAHIVPDCLKMNLWGGWIGRGGPVV
jgi:hypothetical protein